MMRHNQLLAVGISRNPSASTVIRRFCQTWVASRFLSLLLLPWVRIVVWWRFLVKLIGDWKVGERPGLKLKPTLVELYKSCLIQKKVFKRYYIGICWLLENNLKKVKSTLSTWQYDYSSVIRMNKRAPLVTCFYTLCVKNKDCKPLRFSVWKRTAMFNVL